MASFVDNYGLLHPYHNQPIEKAEQTYFIIKKNRQIVCEYQPETGLYAFPSIATIELTSEPTLRFELKANIIKNNAFVCERQHYSVYDVTDAQIEKTPLQWCDIDDILVGKISFDATQRRGFKNFLVRVK